MAEQLTFNPKLKAQQLWSRFAGMFGAEALERKYGSEPPEEWIAMLSRLKIHEIDRGLRRLAYSGRDSVPSLPAFVKLARHVGDELDDKPAPLVQLPGKDSFMGDDWDASGNIHLMGHLMRSVREKQTRYGPIVPYTPGITARCYSAEQKRSTEILIKHRKQWSADMRSFIDPETGEIGAPPIAYQKADWAHLMLEAEAEIAKALAPEAT